MVIKCPYCGKSHYEEGFSTRTAMYFTPIIKDGVNINEDRNITTTRCKCLECNKYFNIKEQAGNTWVEEAPQPESVNTNPMPIDANITVKNIDEYAAIAPQLSIATVNAETNEPMRKKYQWEIDIEEMKKDIQEMKNDIRKLVENNVLV